MKKVFLRWVCFWTIPFWCLYADSASEKLALQFGAGMADAASPTFLQRYWHEGAVFSFAFGIDLRNNVAISFSLTHYTFDYRSGVEPRGDKAGVNVFVVRPEYRRLLDTEGNYFLVYAAGAGFGVISVPPVFEKQEESEKMDVPPELLEAAYQNGGPAVHAAVGIERLLHMDASLACEVFAEGLFLPNQDFTAFGVRVKIKFKL